MRRIYFKNKLVTGDGVRSMICAYLVNPDTFWP